MNTAFDQDDAFRLQDSDSARAGDKSEGDSKIGMHIAPSSTMRTIRFMDHYVQMERTMDMKNMWVWILNGVVTVGCFIAFLYIKGSELVIGIYIPLDLFFNIAKTVFYWYYCYVDMK